MTDCVFCKIVKGELPAKRKYEDELVLAFEDTKPSSPVHILIIPKKHINNISAVSEEDEKILGRCQLVAKKLARKLEIQAFRLSTLNGEDAGQVVFHLHYHLMGGWEKGKFPKLV